MLGLPLWVWLFVLPSALCLICLFAPSLMRPILRPVWAILDRIYVGSGVIAACFMVVILVLIVCQMIARWIGVQFAGSTEFAGYAMAATSFRFANPCFSHTQNSNLAKTVLDRRVLESSRVSFPSF